MFEEKIMLDLGQMQEFTNMVKEFVENRNIILEEEKSNNYYLFTIYDRKPESSSFIGIIDMFMGRNFLPKRLRIQLKVLEEYDKILINLTSNVVMLDWNLIDDKPRRRDQIRLELLTEDLVKKILKLKNRNDA